MSPDTVKHFAETDFRGKHTRFGIKRADRQYHMAIVGRTGMGKSTLMETLMAADIHAGSGFALLDPHGDTAEAIVKLIPPDRAKDLIYFNPSDPSSALGLNILESPGTKKSLVVSGVISVFKKIWSDSWGPRMEHLFRYALTSLVEVEGTTLADVARILMEKDYRAWILEHVTDATIHEFWRTEYERYGASFKTEAISPILNKTGSFLVNPEIRNVVTKQRSDFDLQQIMQSGGIFVANLSKGKLGEDGSALLGSLLSTKFEFAALSRASIPAEDRRDFYLYVDEFPTLASASFTGMLSESRKYHLSLVLAMQYIEQLEEDVRNALFENVGTLIVFRVGPESARYLAPQFAPTLSKEDLMNIGRYCVYLKLMIDGMPSKPFSARTLRPWTS
ncbi:MAG TPA: type IV secretion system DNA-binding domain-containing protein [Terriglobia bacterium]|nr:type IV secretion system DNA-binding domain-containing protein [Terriglobia bacterium]